MYDFAERFTWMTKARQLLDHSLYPKWAYNGRFVVVGGSSGSEWVNRTVHVDVMLQTGQGLQTLAIDEKIDRKLRDTIIAETVSMKESGVPGWMVPGVSKADVLLWAFTRRRPPGLDVYTLWFDQFRAWFWKYEQLAGWPEYSIRNTSWTTVGRSVPLADIPRSMFLHYKETLTVQPALL